MTRYRVLVTGWRFWPRSHEGFVHRKLAEVHAEYPELVVVQGKCPKGGVDRYAEEWAEATNGVRNEPHPADWARYGSAAGSIRNGEMVALGAHICLAFPQDRWGPSGTVNCYNQARTAGILTIVYPWDEVTGQMITEEIDSDSVEVARLRAAREQARSGKLTHLRDME